MAQCNIVKLFIHYMIKLDDKLNMKEIKWGTRKSIYLANQLDQVWSSY